jgi:hypothetical protein
VTAARFVGVCSVCGLIRPVKLLDEQGDSVMPKHRPIRRTVLRCPGSLMRPKRLLMLNQGRPVAAWDDQGIPITLPKTRYRTVRRV